MPSQRPVAMHPPFPTPALLQFRQPFRPIPYSHRSNLPKQNLRPSNHRLHKEFADRIRRKLSLLGVEPI